MKNIGAEPNKTPNAVRTHRRRYNIDIRETDGRVCLMAQYQFVCYPKCSTCKKAQKWLDDRDYVYEYRDISEENPTEEEIRTWHAMSGLPIRKLFNTSGRKYRELELKKKLDEGISDEEAYRILASDGMLVKRPILIGRNKQGKTVALFGFSEKAWDDQLFNPRIAIQQYNLNRLVD